MVWQVVHGFRKSEQNEKLHRGDPHSRHEARLNGNLRYPNDNDRSLNEAAADKILKYRADYNNNPPQA